MTRSLQGKKVIVTAGASGIGRKIAENFMQQGASVCICDISDEQIANCEQELEGIKGFKADVSDYEAVDSFFDEALGFLGGLDVLVNNAGIAGPSAPLEEITPQQWDTTIAINLNGQFYCLRRAIPIMKANKSGSIINLSSTAGLFGYPNRSPYSASKWAVIGLTKTMAMELGEYGIRVNAICPGSVSGPRIDAVIENDAITRGLSPKEVRDIYLSQVSLRTFVSSQEIADMILFLCSESGRSISGQVLAIDGHTETLQ